MIAPTISRPLLIVFFICIALRLRCGHGDILLSLGNGWGQQSILRTVTSKDMPSPCFSSFCIPGGVFRLGLITQWDVDSFLASIHLPLPTLSCIHGVSSGFPLSCNEYVDCFLNSNDVSLPNLSPNISKECPLSFVCWYVDCLPGPRAGISYEIPVK